MVVSVLLGSMPDSPSSCRCFTMRVLVTGGAGYIGSHTAKELHQAGHEVVVLDNLYRGNEWAVRWGPLERCDIRDRQSLRLALARYDIQAVMHFAALAYVGESMSIPSDYYDVNVGGTLQLLQAACAAGIRHIVFSSTCATYGSPDHLPITEDTPQLPVNPYGETKLTAERMLRWFSSAYGMRYVSLRYFNAAGADPDGEIGESHTPETHVIPRLLFSARDPKASFQVFGNDFPTPDGTAVRDYVHVTDLARAHLLALTYLAHGGDSTAVNLGTGSGTSVKELLRTAELVTGRSILVEWCPRRAGDPAALVASSQKATSVLNWTPRLSTPETILRTAWAWHSREHATPGRSSTTCAPLPEPALAPQAAAVEVRK